MKKRLCALGLVCALLLSLCGCTNKEPEEILYDHFVRQETEFTLYTEDCNATFVKMFTAHPEELIHLDTVSMQQTALGYKITLEYANTDVDAAEILCGTEEEIALKALQQTLEKAETNGMMVLTGGGQPSPEEYSDRLAEENYLVTMGLKGGQWQLVTNDFTQDVLVTYTLEYHASSDKILQYRKAVAEQVEELAGKLWQEDTSAEQRVRAIHDYLIDHTKYNEGEVDLLEDHTPYGPLLKGKSVCDGYTYAAQLLLDAAGIQNYAVSGTAGGEAHSWNIVALDGKYYHLDITWDDPVDPTGADHLTYDYYLKSDADFLIDHVWNPDDLPDCDETYN